MKHKPIRMCVVCRKRDFQFNLIRLQCENKKLIYFKGSGRSFYVCKECINNKKFVKYISKMCKISKEESKEIIKEFA